PLAGAPDRSPIPLADSVSGGVAAVQAGARQARGAAGGLFARLVWRIQDLMPQRGPRYRKVTPMSSRRESQRRAAVALLAFVALVGVLGFGIWALVPGPKTADLTSLTVGQRALEAARSDIGQVFGEGIDLVADDQPKALELLTDAYHQLDAAAEAGIPEVTVGAERAKVVAGLDRIWHVVSIAPRSAFLFSDTSQAADLVGLVRGPDAAPYVLDRGAKTVFRIDLQQHKATVVVRAGQDAAGTKVAEPKFVAVGGPDLLVLDAKNVLWRWRPADREGAGTLTKVKVSGSTSWGADIRGIGTFIRNADEGLYNLYVVDPSERQVLRYSPAADGSGYPRAPTGYLATAQSVDGVSGLLIDGDVYLVDDGAIERLRGGRTGDWVAHPPGDELLRRAPRLLAVASPSPNGEGTLYAYDVANARVIAYDKVSGEFREQYRLAGGASGFSDVRGMYVTLGAEDEPPTLWWIIRNRLVSAVLQAVPEPSQGQPGQSSPAPTTTGSARPTGSSGAAPASNASASRRPGATPSQSAEGAAP
ncbi:MAG TPA: hypothetical protein VIV06_02345, partial [Candidatus Limnocylindrales bacterium]